MKKITELPLEGSIAFLLNNADMYKLGFGIRNNKNHIMALCDACGAQIDKGSYIYVPVMNHILCQKCFEDWQKNGTWYPEDNAYQYTHALNVANNVPTIEYNNVNTDSDDKYANLSDKELKEIYDDMVADDEISRQKEL